MKKFWGVLLVLVGTAMTIFFGSLSSVWMSSRNSFGEGQPLYAALYIAIAIFGVVTIVYGRKLYRANAESPQTKVAVGRLMMIAGLSLAIFGVCFAFVWIVFDYDPVWVLGAGSLVAGLIYLITGKAKAGAGRKADLSGGQTVKNRISGYEESRSSRAEDLGPLPQTKMMVCAECGKTYPLGQVYCDECGSLLREQV